MSSTIPSLTYTVTIKPANWQWHYIALLSIFFLMYQYVTLETFFWAVQESTFNGNVNHRQHFTLIDEIARQFFALHLIIWMSPKAIFASRNTLGIATLSVQITRKNVTASTIWGRKKPDSSVLSALNNEVEPAELRDWQGRCFLALLVQPIGCRFPSHPGPSAAFSSFTLTFH